MYLVELVKLQILFWVLEIRDIFGLNGRCWGRPKYKKNMSVPPPPRRPSFCCDCSVSVPVHSRFVATLSLHHGSFSYGCSVAVPV